MTALASTAVRTVRSVCSYCGVGCGLVVRSQQGRVLGVAGDADHPANRGGLCSKGRHIGETLITGDRALHPMRRPLDGGRGFDRLSPWQRVSWPEALRDAAQRLRALQERHGKHSVFFYLSGQLLTEDYYVANKLVKGFLGTNNVDTNSRLCMASASVAYEMAFGSDAPPGCYDDFEHARSVLFIGSNAAETHPILYGRLLQARARTGARWVVVDPRRTATAAAADVHLNITPGSDVALLLAMFNVCISQSLVDVRSVRAHTAGFDAAAEVAREWHPQRAAAVCGVSAELIERAARIVWSSPAALSLWCQGMNQSSAATDKNLALLNLHLATGQIGRTGAGPFSLTGQANAMGGREVGGFATKLAAHRRLDDPAARLLVQNHWGCGPLESQPGLTAVELVDALLDGRVRAVWIAGSNPVVSLPDAERARAALQRAELVVVQDLYHPTDTSLLADLVLPAAAWGEKSGTMTNSERRVTLADAAVPPLGEAREDWRIFAGLGVELGHRAAFMYRNAADVFDEHAALTKGSTCDMSGLSHDRLRRDGPLQWPCPDPTHPGVERRYTDGAYATADRRARLHPTPFRAPAEVPDAAYALRLTTVRTPDAWHTLTRTGKVASLRRGADRATVAVHPDDASSAGVGDGDAVELVSRRGRWRGYARCTDEVPRGTLSASFHWPALRDARAGANLVMPAALDPRSKQPELKHATVRLVRALPLDRILVIGSAGANALAAAMAEQGCSAAEARSWSTMPPPGGAWCVVADESADWEAWRFAARLPSPVVVDAGARIVGRECGRAVGAPIRTTGGLRVTDDPQRQAAAILTGGAAGPRALATAGMRAEGARCSFIAGEPDDQPGDVEQGVRLLSRRDGSVDFTVTWRLAGGQVLGVSASGPRDAVAEVARAWDADLSPEELCMARPDQAADLHGLTVGLLQARHGRELAALVEKHGGVAVHAPCMREIPAGDREAMRASLQRAVEGPLYMAVFLTGIGAATLFSGAVDAGLYDALMARLQSAIVVARGPKPLAVLHRHGLSVDRRTTEPHTTEQVCELVGESLAGRTVLLQHYGTDNEMLAGHLRGAGAELVEAHPYEWGEPVDLKPVHALLDRLVAGEIDITAFTSASQVHMLFQIARAEGREDEVTDALRSRTIVAAVGPVCAAALHDHGVSPRVQPDRPKMVPLVMSLCAYASTFTAATSKADPS